MFLDLLHRGLQSLAVPVARRPPAQDHVAVDHHSALHRHTLGNRLQRLLRFHILRLERDCFANELFNLRQKAFRFAKREALRHQTPETCTDIERLRGPSNSARMMLCQVPSSTHELRTCRESVWPIIIPRKCESAFLRSQSECFGSLWRQSISRATTSS